MSKLVIGLRDGSERVIEAQSGKSLMENIRDAGIDELLALCGGCLSCATCHVHVEEAWIARLPAMSDDEDDLLDSSDDRTSDSRLACQIEFTADMNGMRIVIAAES